MNKKITIALAGIFLALALILPIYMVIEASSENFRDLLQRGSPLDETDIQDFLQASQLRQVRLLTIIAIAELVFVTLFIIALWLSLKT